MDVLGVYAPLMNCSEKRCLYVVGMKQERESFFSQDIGRGRNPRDWNDVCTRDEVCIMDLD